MSSTSDSTDVTTVDLGFSNDSNDLHFDRYDGDLNDDRMRHGHGTYIYQDGSVYEGEWYLDQRQGQGNM